MSDRNKKVQLGARVTPLCREQAVANALSKGLSLNLYLEGLIWDDEKAPTLLDAPKIDGQMDLVDEVEKVENGHTEEMWKRFAPNCSMGVYHWRCGPGNPCSRCGGEI